MIDPKQPKVRSLLVDYKTTSMTAHRISPKSEMQSKLGHITRLGLRESMGNIRHPNASDMEFFDRHDRGSNPKTPNVGVFHTIPHSTEKSSG